MTQQNQTAKLQQSKQIARKQKALIKFNLSYSRNNTYATSHLTNSMEKKRWSTASIISSVFITIEGKKDVSLIN